MLSYKQHRKVIYCKCSFQIHLFTLLYSTQVNGYNIVSTNKLLDYDQTTLALRRLGEFHAMSLVMMEQGTLIPNSFKPIIYQDKENMMVPTMASAVSSIADFIKNEWGPEW